MLCATHHNIAPYVLLGIVSRGQPAVKPLGGVELLTIPEQVTFFQSYV